MAKKIFDAKTQGHSCYNELSYSNGKNTHNDIVKCSCGQLYAWRSEQRESWWKHITEKEAKDIIKKTNPTLSNNEVEEILRTV